MKSATVVAFAFLALSLSVPAFAGTATSGGGRGVVCRDAHGRIKSVELLDLWEAREIYRRKILPSIRPVREQLALAIQRLKYITNTMDETYGAQGGPEIVMSALQDTAYKFPNNSADVIRLRNVTLEDTGDSNEAAFPSDCKVEQLVNFMDSDSSPKILVNQDLLDRMDLTNQAALYVHEALYVLLRQDNNESNSIRTRRAVGYVFAGNAFPSVYDLLGNEYVECRALPTADANDGSTIDFYLNSHGTLSVVGTRIFGDLALGFFPNSANFWEKKSLEDILPENGCTGMGPGGVTLVPMEGPVDFQRDYWLGFDCTDKRLNLSIEKVGNFVGGQKMSCEIVKRPH